MIALALALFIVCRIGGGIADSPSTVEAPGTYLPYVFCVCVFMLLVMILCQALGVARMRAAAQDIVGECAVVLHVAIAPHVLSVMHAD